MSKLIIKGFSITLILTVIMSSYVSLCIYDLYKNTQGDIK